MIYYFYLLDVFLPTSRAQLFMLLVNVLFKLNIINCFVVFIVVMTWSIHSHL